MSGSNADVILNFQRSDTNVISKVLNQINIDSSNEDEENQHDIDDDDIDTLHFTYSTSTN